MKADERETGSANRRAPKGALRYFEGLSPQGPAPASGLSRRGPSLSTRERPDHVLLVAGRLQVEGCPAGGCPSPPVAWPPPRRCTPCRQRRLALPRAALRRGGRGARRHRGRAADRRRPASHIRRDSGDIHPIEIGPDSAEIASSQSAGFRSDGLGRRRAAAHAPTFSDAAGAAARRARRSLRPARHSAERQRSSR